MHFQQRAQHTFMLVVNMKHSVHMHMFKDMHVLHEDISEEAFAMWHDLVLFREACVLRHAVPAVNKCESASMCTQRLCHTVLHGMSGLPPNTCAQP